MVLRNISICGVSLAASSGQSRGGERGARGGRQRGAGGTVAAVGWEGVGKPQREDAAAGGCQSGSPGCGAALRARAEGLDGLGAAFCSPRATRGQQVLTDQAGHNCPRSPTGGTATRSPHRSGGLPRAPSCSPAPAQGMLGPARQAVAMPSPKPPVPATQDATPKDGGVAHGSSASSPMPQRVREPHTHTGVAGCSVARPLRCVLGGGRGWHCASRARIPSGFPRHRPTPPRSAACPALAAGSDGAGRAPHRPVGCCSDNSSLQEKFPGEHAY